MIPPIHLDFVKREFHLRCYRTHNAQALNRQFPQYSLSILYRISKGVQPMYMTDRVYLTLKGILEYASHHRYKAGQLKHANIAAKHGVSVRKVDSLSNSYKKARAETPEQTNERYLMNMTEQDWESYLSEHSLSLVYEYKFKSKPVPVTQDKKPKTEKRTQSRIFNYKWIEKTTPKAKFYVTHETISEIHGFWCPKAAIISDGSMAVEIANWCEIKIINFV